MSLIPAIASNVAVAWSVSLSVCSFGTVTLVSVSTGMLVDVITYKQLILKRD